ncbi:MAG: hypothetical protein K6E97_11335 [Treponema sp.]|nr:hypothetical protein [Treponema sp.]
MDDKQYYAIKRITSLTPDQLQKNLKKTASSKFKDNKVRQGHDDAEMLLEKQDDFDKIEE